MSDLPPRGFTWAELATARKAEIERLRAAALTDTEIGTIQSAVENLRSADKTDARVEAAWRIAFALEQIAKHLNQQSAQETK